MNSIDEPCEQPLGGPRAASVAPAQAGQAARGQVSTGAEGGYEVRLSITAEERDDLRRAQALLGHAIPSGDPALVYARAMNFLVAHLEKQRLGVKPASATAVPRAGGRGIPKPLRRFVWERDGSRCAFLSADGHRCESTRRLEIDHIQPLALGGRTEPENLRVLCRAHNQFEAERVLGKEHVERKRELAQRERAQVRAAKAASASHTKVRAADKSSLSSVSVGGAAKHPHHDDILAALLGLGFKQAEARRGAELAAERLEASLEACVRRALTELTRAVVVRGERRARCSA